MLKPFSLDRRNSFGLKIIQYIQGYNHRKYWSRRAAVIDPQDTTPIIVKLWYLFYIKRTDARHGCSFGTNFHAGARFATPPRLPHGPAGIFIGHDVMIGANVTIFQQVTVAHGGGGAQWARMLYWVPAVRFFVGASVTKQKLERTAS